MRHFTKFFLALNILFICSCATTVEPTGGRSFDVQSKKQCIQICKQADMDFSALVVIGGMSGCVCDNKESKKTSSTGAMGGAVAVLIARQQAQAAAAQQQHQMVRPVH
jgi:hypothetical protein